MRTTLPARRVREGRKSLPWSAGQPAKALPRAGLGTAPKSPRSRNDCCKAATARPAPCHWQASGADSDRANPGQSAAAQSAEIRHMRRYVSRLLEPNRINAGRVPNEGRVEFNERHPRNAAALHEPFRREAMTPSSGTTLEPPPGGTQPRPEWPCRHNTGKIQRITINRR